MALSFNSLRKRIFPFFGIEDGDHSRLSVTLIEYRSVVFNISAFHLKNERTQIFVQDHKIIFFPCFGSFSLSLHPLHRMKDIKIISELFLQRLINFSLRVRHYGYILFCRVYKRH